jgi:hypothetical protein
MPGVASSEAIVLKVTNGGNEKICPQTPTYWRMLFDIRPRFVYTAGLYGEIDLIDKAVKR